MKLAAALTRFHVPKSRSGRRPISVVNLLKRDEAGTLFKHLLKEGAVPRQIRDAIKRAEDLGTNGSGFKLQGKLKFQGLPIAVENRAGSTRSGTNPDGSKWRTVFKIPYGYIEGTEGADNEEVDAYVGPHKDAPNAHVVHQKNDKGGHDEDTVMLGFKTPADAKSAILKHYDDPKYVGSVSTVPMGRLRQLVASGKKLVKISSMPRSFNFQGVDRPDTVGSPASSQRHPGDVPSRETAPARPRVENRAEASAQVPNFPLPSNGSNGADQVTGSLDKMALMATRTKGNGLDIQSMGDSAKVDPSPVVDPSGEFSKLARFYYAGFFDELTKEAEVKEAFREAIRSLRSRFARPAELRGKWSQGLGPGLSDGGAMLKGPNTAGLSAQDAATARAIRPTSATRRIVGETAQGAGHHLQHSSGLQKALNPIGVPFGGAVEGLTKGIGKELQGARSTRAQSVGRGLERHAGKVGLMGELGAVGGLGAALHMPLSAAGALGGHAAPILAHAGALGHIGQDAVGTALQSGAKRVAGFLPKFAEVTEEQAQASAKHLAELERTEPSLNQLQRGALVGSIVSPAASIMAKSIGGNWKSGIIPNLRELAASSASGAVFGGLMPAVRQHIETNAEKDVLERFNAQKVAGVWDAVKRVALTEIPGTKPWLLNPVQKATRFGQAAVKKAPRPVERTRRLPSGAYDVSALAARMGVV